MLPRAHDDASIVCVRVMWPLGVVYAVLAMSIEALVGVMGRKRRCRMVASRAFVETVV